jgi:ferredoxin-NADP reductase
VTAKVATPPAHLHPAYATAKRTLRVVEAVDLTPQVRHIVLAHPEAPGRLLTPHEPGAHLVVTAGDKRNAYSLTGDGVSPRRYAISVLRKGAGGGSEWMHDGLAVGDLIEVEGPRSSFAPRHGQRHAFVVAGGIGITPVLSHARAAARWGLTVEILYSYRPGHAAHLDDVHRLAELSGITLREATTVEETADLLAERFADQPLGSHAYACGPVAMLDAYLAAGRAAGWPERRLHLERFSAPELDAGVEFRVSVASTGQRLTVPSGVSLLQTLLDAGLPVSNLCRQGVCGECEIPVASGVVEHRDLVLSESERAAGDRMLCCVSRGEEIEVDL